MKVWVSRFYANCISVAVHGINHVLTVQEARKMRDLLSVALEQVDGQPTMTEFAFKVIDNQTGKEPDCAAIALSEDWAKELIYCDMEGFALEDDGTLVLLDECGKFVYCPIDRFGIVFDSVPGMVPHA